MLWDPTMHTYVLRNRSGNGHVVIFGQLMLIIVDKGPAWGLRRMADWSEALRNRSDSGALKGWVVAGSRSPPAILEDDDNQNFLIR